MNSATDSGPSYDAANDWFWASGRCGGTTPFTYPESADDCELALKHSFGDDTPASTGVEGGNAMPHPMRHEAPFVVEKFPDIPCSTIPVATARAAALGKFAADDSVRLPPMHRAQCGLPVFFPDLRE